MDNPESSNVICALRGHCQTCRPVELAFCLSLTVALSCSTGTDRRSAAYELTDSAGVEIVESFSPLWGDPVIRLQPEPFLRLGREEEGPEQFSFIAHGLLLEGERLAVTELSAAQVRVFDWTGKPLGTFGGNGDGPGEFRSTTALFEFRGDSIAVYDQRLHRTTILSLESGAFRSIPNRFEGNFVVFGISGDARLFFSNWGGGYRPDLEPGLQWDITDIVSTEPEQGSPTVITRLPSRQQVVLPDGNTESLIPAHSSIQAVGRDGFYWATTNQYEVGFYDGEGALLRLLRRPIEPSVVTPEMVKEYIEANLDRVRRFEGEQAVPRYRARYEDAVLGDRVPLFGRALVDQSQRLWVSEPLWPALSGTPSRWSVFSAKGVWLADVEAPDRLRILDSRDEVVLGVWLDEFDVPHVQLHRLIR